MADETPKTPETEPMSGGPGDMNPAPETEVSREIPEAPPLTEKVSIGGTEYDVPPEVAATMRANTAMLDQYQTALHQPKPEPKAETQPSVDYETLMFTDPQGFAKKLQDDAVARAKKELTAEYQRDQNTRQFFDGFYQKHEDLKDADDLVRSELQTNFNAWSEKPANEVMDLLADKVRNRILSYVNTYSSNSSGGMTPKTTTESGGSNPVQGGTSAPEGGSTKSASQIIRMRRQQRRQGSGG